GLWVSNDMRQTPVGGSVAMNDTGPYPWPPLGETPVFRMTHQIRDSDAPCLQQLAQFGLVGRVQALLALLGEQFVNALAQGLAVELGDGVEELQAPAGVVAGQVQAGELLKRAGLLAAFEVAEQGAGTDVRARADDGDQLGQQLDARLAQGHETVRRLQL